MNAMKTFINQGKLSLNLNCRYEGHLSSWTKTTTSTNAWFFLWINFFILSGYMIREAKIIFISSCAYCQVLLVFCFTFRYVFSCFCASLHTFFRVFCAIFVCSFFRLKVLSVIVAQLFVTLYMM